MANSLAVCMPGRYLYMTGGVFVLLLFVPPKIIIEAALIEKKKRFLGV